MIGVRHVVMRVLLECHFILAIGKLERHLESMGFRDFLCRFPIAIILRKTERLARAVRPERFQAQWMHIRAAWSCAKCQPKPWRYILLKDGQFDDTLIGVDFLAVALMVVLGVSMTVAMTMMFAAAQQPRAGNVHQQADHGNRNRLRKVNRNRRE